MGLPRRIEDDLTTFHPATGLARHAVVQSGPVQRKDPRSQLMLNRSRGSGAFVARHSHGACRTCAHLDQCGHTRVCTDEVPLDLAGDDPEDPLCPGP